MNKHRSKIIFIILVILAVLLLTLILVNRPNSRVVNTVTSPVPTVAELQFDEISDIKLTQNLVNVFQSQQYPKIVKRIINYDRECQPYPVIGDMFRWVVEDQLAHGFYFYNIGKTCKLGKKGSGYPAGGLAVFFLNVNGQWLTFEQAVEYPQACQLIDKKLYSHDTISQLGCK